MPITHTKVSGAADSGDTTLVRPSDWNAGHVIELDYVAYTAPVAASAATQAGANTVVTGNAVTYDGSTKVMIEYWAPYAYSGLNGTLYVDLWMDGSLLATLYQAGSSSHPAMYYGAILARCQRTPSAGSHTFTIKAWRITIDGSLGGGNGSPSDFVPGYMRITKV
jgi:hypothetical protein